MGDARPAAAWPRPSPAFDNTAVVNSELTRQLQVEAHG